MAESFVQYTASGSTDTYSIPFGYLDPSHITVSLDGVSTAFTFPSSSQVQITSGNPTAGVVVEVRRTTPRDTREVVWQNSSNLTASDLNTSDLQLLYITQESFDNADSTIQLKSDGTFDADNKRIKNLADPVNNNDAVNKSYADQNLIATASDVVDAEAARDAAATSAANAALSEASAASLLAQVQVIYDDFDDRYLGSKSSDPTVDNDGDPLNSGDLYFNTINNNMRVYDGSTWLILDLQIADNAVSNTKLQDMAEATIKGRQAGTGTGDPEDLTAAQVRTIIGQASTSTQGLVEKATSGEMSAGGTNKFPDANEVKTYVDAAVAANVVNHYESAETVFVNGNTYSFAHGLGAMPDIIEVVAVCKTAEAGILVNEEFVVDVIHNGANNFTGAQRLKGITNIRVIISANGLVFNGALLTASNFRLKVRAVKF